MTLIKQSVMSQSLDNRPLTNQAIGDLESHTKDAGLNDTLNTLENSFEKVAENDLEHSLGNNYFNTRSIIKLKVMMLEITIITIQMMMTSYISNSYI
jgi:hypothetical protein|tara:strand:- start:137 stop:427 length:291 start_codon:yes stop_codon:yes gene_type:complete